MTEQQKEAMRVRQSSCFAPFLGNQPWAARAAAAVVQIMSITPAGNTVASGTVVRNSAQLDGGTNGILTAMHVPEAAATGAPGTAIGILSTNGEPLGWAEVVAKGHASRGDSGSAVRGFERGDISVLRIRGFVGNGEKIFRAIEGVDIRDRLNTHVMKGDISKPAGTNPGISGASALDPDGKAYGVVIRRMAENQESGNWKIRGVKQDGVDPMVAPGRNGERASRQVILPQSGTTYVESLLQPEILASLGGAASNVVVQDGGTTPIPTTMFGFPSGVCIGYRGDMVPMP